MSAVRAGFAVLASVVAALGAPGCGSGAPPTRAAGSTLAVTILDRNGDGALERGPAEPLLDRTELAPRLAPGRVLARFAQISDAHVADEESPGRLEALDRAGPPFASAFRPQEALATQVLAAATRALDRRTLDAVVETGDLVDGAQADEYAMALATLAGGRVDPDTGRPGYEGVQSAGASDPAYYRPDVDAPRHPGLMTAAQRPFRAHGLRAPWYPVAGNHDLLVAGILPRSRPLEALATGSRRIVEPPRDLRLQSAGRDLSAAALDRRPKAARLADTLLREGRLGRTARVAPDPRRELVDPRGALALLRGAGARGGHGPRLDYTFNIGTAVRGIVLDAVSRSGGSGGTLSGGQIAWLAHALRVADRRWVVVFSHQPLDSFPAGRRVLGILDAHPRVLAAIAGHTHRNRIVPRRTDAGGYWLITTASLVDFPQQVRLFSVRATAEGAVMETWLSDTSPSLLADVARELAYLDAQGGRPGGLRGDRIDRNVRLYVAG